MDNLEYLALDEGKTYYAMVTWPEQRTFTGNTSWRTPLEREVQRIIDRATEQLQKQAP